MSELTTSKVNRQFRTLRSKCTALNTLVLSPPKPTVTVTYSRQNVQRKPLQDDETPPLAILQSLDKFGARLHLDRAIVENMQLSKRIYEVRDAFKNIVQSTFGNPQGDNKGASRILPLTGICARKIGEFAQSEADAAVNDDPDSEGHEDEIRSQVIDELYESVPTQHRHFTIVAHTLTYILDTCPHHPTLLNVLLEVCLHYSLVSEAHTLLRELFTVAILPRPHSTCPCPLTHPAHKNFLITLRETCTGSGPSYGSHPNRGNCIVNDQTFTRILVDALSAPCPEQLHAWTSKAVVRLARDLRERDFGGCFIPLCIGLAHAVSQLDQPKKAIPTKASKHGKTIDDVHSQLLADALERLAKWTGSMLETLHRRAPASGSSAELPACADFLVAVEPLRLHVSTEPATSPITCLADALCCLAAYCLATSPSPAPIPTTEHDLLVLQNILRTAHVKNTTFDGLASHIFPLPTLAIFRDALSPTEEDTPIPLSTIPAGSVAAIDALASPLRARGLLQCEVALYLSALQHVEELIATPVLASSPGQHRQLSDKELFNLRLQLMDRVEDAEQRCYSGRAGNGGSGNASRPPEGSSEQEWIWEEMVGSWVVKSPAIAKAKAAKDRDLARASKRRKLEFEDGCGPAASSKASSASVGRHTAAFRAPLIVSYEKGKENRYSNNDASDDDAETCPATPAAPKRIRNFTTILADSHRNVISLRAEREAKAKAQSQNGGRAEAKPQRQPRASAPVRIVRFAVPDSPASAGPWNPRPVHERRRSNFATVLADSHKNAISLREERAAAAGRQPMAAASRTKRKRSVDRSAGRDSAVSESEDEREDVHGRRQRIEPESSPVGGAAWVEPSSDDALNLFAYPDSSPVKARGCV